MCSFVLKPMSWCSPLSRKHKGSVLIVAVSIHVSNPSRSTSKHLVVTCGAWRKCKSNYSSRTTPRLRLSLLVKSQSLQPLSPGSWYWLSYDAVENILALKNPEKRREFNTKRHCSNSSLGGFTVTSGKVCRDITRQIAMESKGINHAARPCSLRQLSGIASSTPPRQDVSSATFQRRAVDPYCEIVQK